MDHSKFKQFELRLQEVESELSKPEIVQDQNQYQLLSKEHVALSNIVRDFHHYLKLSQDLEEVKKLLEEHSQDDESEDFLK